MIIDPHHQNIGFLGGVYDDIDCQEEFPRPRLINQQLPQIDEIMGGGVIPDEDEEEECDDEDCEYCRQYYLE